MTRMAARRVLAGLVLLIALGAGAWWLARPSPQQPPRPFPVGAGRVTALPASVDFGESMVGAGSRTRTVTIRNGSVSALRIGHVFVEGDDAAAFAADAAPCTRAVVGPGRSCTLRVRFLPGEAGARSGTLSLETGVPDGLLTVALTGAAAAPAVEVDHTRLDFGAQAVGARSAVQAVTVRNGGSAPVSLEVLPARSGDAGAMAEFPVVSTGCPMAPMAPLGAGRTCTIAVAFEPAAPGGRSAILAIRPAVPTGSPGLAEPGSYGSADSAGPEGASGAGRGGTVSVALAGVGTEAVSPAALVASSAEVDFDRVVAGARSAATTLTLSNTSGSRLQVLGVRVEGASAAEFAVAGTTCRAGSSLRPGGRCIVGLVFQPSGSAGAGGRSATVVVDHAGPAGPEGAARSLTVALTGERAVASPAADRTREDFGTLPLGTAADLRTLSIRNDGGALLGIGTLALAGADAGDFVLSADRCSGTAVEPGRTCTVALGFDPRREGGRSATLVVPHDAGGTPLTIALSGAGAVAADLSVAIAPPPGPGLGPDEPSGPGDGSSGRWRITVRNAGPRDATSVRLVVSGEAVSLDWARTGPWRCDEAGRSSARVTCTMPVLPRSGRAVLDLGVVVAGDEGVPSLTAAVRAGEPDPRGSDDKAHALVPIPGPAPSGP